MSNTYKHTQPLIHQEAFHCIPMAFQPHFKTHPVTMCICVFMILIVYTLTIIVIVTVIL